MDEKIVKDFINTVNNIMLFQASNCIEQHEHSASGDYVVLVNENFKDDDFSNEVIKAIEPKLSEPLKKATDGKVKDYYLYSKGDGKIMLHYNT